MIVKSELIERLTKKQSFIIDAAEVGSIVHLLLETMANTLQQGGRIEVRGFGSFSLRYHQARRARNPKTGEKLMAEPHYGIHFKPGKAMRERLDQSRSEVAIQYAPSREGRKEDIEQST